jgi:dienelactone hydrolase
VRALLGAGVLALLVWAGGCVGVMRAASLLRDAQRPAHELAGRVHEWEERVDGVQVLFYRPRTEASAFPAMVLVHGAVDTGARESRMVALARALALRDVLVACPDLPSLRTFRADPEDLQRLGRIALAVADRPGTEGGEVALLGISIGGSYCILAAAHPDLRERTSAVMGFGAYEDLERLVTTWMVSPKPNVPELYDPLVEGRRLVFLGNVEGLLPAEDHAVARRALRALVRGDPVAQGAAQELGAPGRRLLECALSTEPIDPAVAAAVLAPVVEDLRALSPARAGAVPAAPVFVLHGESDPIVPVTDAPRLTAALERRGARVRLHETDLFTHVGGTGGVSFLRSWPLLRFVARFLGAAGIQPP